MPTLTRRSLILIVTAALMALVAVPGVSAQVGKTQGLADVNTVQEKDLAALAHMTPEIVKGIMDARPFESPTELNALLLKHHLKPEQATEFYRKAFVHINLNTASSEEIMLIPGAGRKMAHEFEEYRPWKSWKQFDREIGKYVGPEEVARLAQYGFIPVNLNTASDEDILSIPGVGKRMLHEFKEYRPYTSMDQFRKEIGKYVDEKEVKRLARYVTIE
jgi:DNA uptake protein ComE-like DNA-binding protein